MLEGVGHWVASTGELVGNVVTALPPPNEAPTEGAVTVRQPVGRTVYRATSGEATSGRVDSPCGLNVDQSVDGINILFRF